MGRSLAVRSGSHQRLQVSAKQFARQEPLLLKLEIVQ
jgi:hypothetical protein